MTSGPKRPEQRALREGMTPGADLSGMTSLRLDLKKGKRVSFRASELPLKLKN